MSEAFNKPRVAVLGLGYVGCVSAACLARQGYEVTGIDPDAYKVDCVLRGAAPFYEPGLDDLVRETVAAGALRATTSLAEGIAGVDIALVCVGTPSERNGNLSTAALYRVANDLRPLLQDRPGPLVVAIRSTVFPGTCEEVVMANIGPRAIVVANPEFLREGAALRDFLEPSLIVVGGEPDAARRVASLYAGLGAEPCLVSLRTAEMIKYACNTFHAVKIAFANEIGTLAARLGVSGEEVMETVCRDEKLNLSAAYLKPGFAFGGSCLPKDLRALVYRASRLDVDLPLLTSVLPSNDAHLKRAAGDVLDLSGRIGIFGLAFKENTDDLRESPTVTLIESLIGKGREVRVYDPHIKLDQLHGSNRSFVLSAIPHIGRLLETDLAGMLAWAEHVVVTQKPDSRAEAVLAASGIPTLRLDRAPRC